MTPVSRKTTGAVAENMIRLFPFFHARIFARERGVSGKQIAGFRVLGVMLRHGPLPISEVGKRLYISKPYMTRLVDDLIADELVERLRDESDRRVINIQITAKGRKRIREIGGMFRDDIEVLLAELDDDDIRVLDESLTNLTRILGKLQESPAQP